MILTVVRHLEPLPVVGAADPLTDLDRPLSREGAAQGDALLRNVRAACPDDAPWGRAYGAGYVSPYARCRQTAALIADAVDHGARWYEVPELRESAHAAQVSRLRTKMLVNEESSFELRDRVARLMSMIHESTYPVLVVTHGDVVNAFRWVVEGRTLAQYRALYDDPDNYVPFGVAWTFDTVARTAERRLLRDAAPDKVVGIHNTFAHGVDSYRIVPARLGE